MSARKAKPNPAMKLIVVSNRSSLGLCSFPPRVLSRCDPQERAGPLSCSKEWSPSLSRRLLLSKRGIIAGLGLSLGCTQVFRRQMFRALSPRSRCFQTHTHARARTRAQTHTSMQEKRKILVNETYCLFSVQAVSWCQTHYRFLCVIVRALHPVEAHRAFFFLLQYLFYSS